MTHSKQAFEITSIISMICWHCENPFLFSKIINGTTFSTYYFFLQQRSIRCYAYHYYHHYHNPVRVVHILYYHWASGLLLLEESFSNPIHSHSIPNSS